VRYYVDNKSKRGSLAWLIGLRLLLPSLRDSQWRVRKKSRRIRIGN